MAQLSARERASLPDRAFAYIDSKGKRRLPIHDEAYPPVTEGPNPGRLYRVVEAWTGR